MVGFLCVKLPPLDPFPLPPLPHPGADLAQQGLARSSDRFYGDQLSVVWAGAGYAVRPLYTLSCCFSLASSFQETQMPSHLTAGFQEKAEKSGVGLFVPWGWNCFC